MKKLVVTFLIIALPINAQSIQGNFKSINNTEITLKGYYGFTTKELASTTTDSVGNFTLNYPVSYRGAGVLEIKNRSSLIVLLNQENFKIHWENLKDFSSLQFVNSPENDYFIKAMTIGQEADMRLAGLKYVLPFYTKNPKKLKWLNAEIAIQEQAYTKFLTSLPKNSYAAPYLKVRKLLVDMPQTANRYIERMSQHEMDFAAIDFNEDYLWHSGLMGDLFDGFYQLMESHIDAKTFENHANAASDAWIVRVKGNSIKLQDIGEYNFKILEKRSQFKAAEHIALTLLDQTNCQIDAKRTNLFEQYRKMAIGNTAPNITLDSAAVGKKRDLKGLENNYKLVVFGASWCPNCQTDYPKLKEDYLILKEKYDLEILYISVDTDKKVFETYYKEAPFITFCDTKGWDTQAAKAYCVFGTPTYFLLDKDLSIKAKLNSPAHLVAWLAAHIKTP